MRRLLLISIVIAAGCNQCCGDESSLRDSATKTLSAPGIIYRNPWVYNVDYSFELVPDPNKIDRAKDLKLWIPIPQEWDSQKAVKIISVQPPPHAEYEDPEHGNRMLFWDFGKEPEKPSYKVDIKYRLESYEVCAEVDPNKVGSYDITSKEYTLYTRSTRTVSITPKIRELARQVIGDEENPYIQAKRIAEFSRNKIRYKQTFGRGIKFLLDNAVRDKQSGEEYYLGACDQYNALFVALCRSVGIPARAVAGFVGYRPWITAADLKEPFSELDTMQSPEGLSGGQHYTAMSPHVWSEFYLPNYGWIPAETMGSQLGYWHNRRLIMHKGRDVKIGPQAPNNNSGGYGFQWVALNNGRADLMQSGVWNIAKIRTAKVKILHSFPFPVVKYFVYFLTAIILAIIVGGLAGFICFHKFKKYALIGLSSVVPFVGLALPVAFVRREEQIGCSKVRFVSLFWIFSIFLLWLLVFPVIVETDLISWGAWKIISIIVVCILSVLVSWILVSFLCRKSWIKNKPIRVIIKTILFGVFWIVAARILVVWIMFYLVIV